MNINLENVFDTFKRKRVLIIGDSMLDAYLWGEVNRISPEAPVPVVLVKKREYRLGGAANVALNIHNLGAEPFLISVIGNDADAKSFVNVLEKSEISTSLLLTSDNRKTTVKTRILGNSHHMLRVDNEDQSHLNDEFSNEIYDKVSSVIEKMDVLIFQDYDKGMLSRPLISNIIELAKKNEVPVVVDPKKDNFLNYINVELFKPNLKELKEGLKIDMKHAPVLKDLKEAVKILKSKIQSEICMITLSENGIFISDKTEEFIIPAIKRDIFDVSGAGDTVISVAALALISGFSSYQIAVISNIAGGMVCEKPGVVPVDRERLLKETREYFEIHTNLKYSD